jgi:hypothetical protein
MSDYKSIKTEELTKIANAIRYKTGKSDKISLEAMAEEIREIKSSSGVELPELTNEGTAADLFSGKELIDGDGNKVTGTFTIDSELSMQDNLIAQIQSVVNNLPDAGSSEPNLQTKTVTPSTSSQSVTPDSGYDGLSRVTVNAIPGSYVQPTTTKAATTYTPTTSNQTIAAGTYCSGIQTIKGDANLVAANIAEGVSIFGITGTHSGGSGGGSVETCTVTIIPSGDSTVYYSYNGQCLSETFSNTKILTVTKGTIITIYMGWSPNSSQTGNCEKLWYSMASAAYAIYGDCTLVGDKLAPPM